MVLRFTPCLFFVEKLTFNSPDSFGGMTSELRSEAVQPHEPRTLLIYSVSVPVFLNLNTWAKSVSLLTSPKSYFSSSKTMLASDVGVVFWANSIA